MKKLMFFVVTLLCSVIAFGQPTNFESRGIGGGGSLFFPTISPNSSTEIYMQCDMSQVFHSTNTGVDWDIIHFNDLVSTGGIHSVQFTNDPNILYTVNNNSLTGEMLPVKSTDGGASWQNITADPTYSEVWAMFADPTSSNRLLVAEYDVLHFSGDGGNSFSVAYDMSGGDFYICGVFWNGDNIFVGTSQGLLVSQDNGATFNFDNSTGLAEGDGFISFTGAASGGVTRLMGTVADQGDLYPGVQGWDSYIYKDVITMDYGAGAWTSASTGVSNDHDLFSISSALNDINIFYASGNNPETSFPVVYKTTDGGNNWNEVFLTTNNENIITGWSGYQGDHNWWYGEYIFGLAVAPNDVNTVVITDYGFVHVSTDGADSWNQAYVDNSNENASGSATPTGLEYTGNGLENTSTWQLHWASEDNMFASYTDITGIRSRDGGDTWSFDYEGIDYNSTYHIIENPSNGYLYAATSTVHDMYQSTYLRDSRIDNGGGAILYSTDGGDNWEVLHDFSMPVVWLALDPNDSDKMYASVINSSEGGIYKTSNLSNDASSFWELTSAPPRTEGHPYNVSVLEDGNILTTWSGRMAPSFTASSGVFMSSDEGATWEDLSMDDKMHYWTKDITVDPNDATQSTWYVAVHSGWGGNANNKGGVYKTTDRGQNWNQISDSYRVESVTIHPTNADELYFTTEFEGLWYSSNASNASPTFTQVDAYDFQHPLRVFYNPYDVTEIWITSFGNGLRVSGGNPDGVATVFTENKAMLFPNPVNDFLTITGISLTENSLKIYNIIGEEVTNLVTSSTYENKIMINTKRLMTGSYVVVLGNGEILKFVRE